MTSGPSFRVPFSLRSPPCKRLSPCVTNFPSLYCHFRLDRTHAKVCTHAWLVPIMFIQNTCLNIFEDAETIWYHVNVLFPIGRGQFSQHRKMLKNLMLQNCVTMWKYFLALEMDTFFQHRPQARTARKKSKDAEKYWYHVNVCSPFENWSFSLASPPKRLLFVSFFRRDALKGELRKDQGKLGRKRTAENAPTRTRVNWTIN